MTTIFIEEDNYKDKNRSRCVHRMGDPPFGSAFGKKGELRQCPDCEKWWIRESKYRTTWRRVSIFDRQAIRTIKNHENRMHTIVASDREVEDD